MVLESLGGLLDYFFNVALMNVNVLRVLVGAIIFSVIYNSMYGVFNHNKAAAIIISLIVAAVGVRFMPNELLLNLTTFIFMFVLFAVPYLLIRRVFSKWWHAVIASVAIASALAFLFRNYLSFSPL